MLSPGTYQTRNSRIAKLNETFKRPKRMADGSQQEISGCRGLLMKADGRTPESEHDWEDTLNPNTLGVFVRVGTTEGVANEFDLVNRIE